MDSDEAIKKKIMDHIERMIKDAYRAGFADGWSKSAQGFNAEVGPYIGSDEYENMTHKYPPKYSDSYDLPE